MPTPIKGYAGPLTREDVLAILKRDHSLHFPIRLRFMTGIGEGGLVATCKLIPREGSGASPQWRVAYFDAAGFKRFDFLAD